MVHRPTAGRMVDQVHRLFSLARLMCTELTLGWSARRGCSPVFFRGGAPVGGERPVSPRGSAGVRLERGKASPGHGDYVCGVKGAATASQGVGHSDRRLKLHRRAGRHGCCGIGHFCGAHGRHSALASMLGRSRGLPGAPVTLATAAAFRAQRRRGARVSTWLQWGGHGVRVVPAIKTSETRERQALPANLSPVESSRWRQCSGRGAVWPLGSSSGLRLPMITIVASSVAGRNQPRRWRDIYYGDAAAVASPRPCACSRRAPVRARVHGA